MAINGHGKNNFVGAWDFPRRESHSISESGSISESWLPRTCRSIWLPVPYPSIPPEYFAPSSSDSDPNMIDDFFTPFTDKQRGIFNQHLWGLWTLPPDDRLDLEFQSHVLRRVPDGDIKRHVEGIRSSLDKLHELGGSFEIIELDNYYGNQYTYRPGFESTSAFDVDEWLLNIPPKFIQVDGEGFPVNTSRGPEDFRIESRMTNQWKRIV